MLKLLVVDDERLAAERLVQLCGRLDDAAVVGVAADGETALRRVAALEPDVVLLDVAMPGLDGLALTRLMAERERPPAVVFVTAHASHAVEAFELAATDYLLKPVSLPRLRLAMARAAVARPSPRSYLTELWVPGRGELLRVGVEALELVEAERDYVRLHTRDHTHLLRATLQDLERRLDPAHFIRVHRSAIIARSGVLAMRSGGTGWSVQLRNGSNVRIGRSFQSLVRRIATNAA